MRALGRASFVRAIVMSRPLFLLLAAAGALAGRANVVIGQSLRGSSASVERMYDEAVREQLSFYESSAGVRQAVAHGDLVPLTPSGDIELHSVAFPYVLPATKTFVERLSEEYARKCGEPLVVTSAVRPESRQPANSSTRSVHPTGMAVDLRRPETSCLTWLRRTLLSLEGDGLIEATEEHRPAHFHVAVFGDAYMRFVASTDGATSTADGAVQAGHPREHSPTTYRVRVGDSLWSIAQRHDTTVPELMKANRLERTRITPGQVLVIP
jgi:hypothetical protein